MQINLKFIKKRTKIQKGWDQAETPKEVSDKEDAEEGCKGEKKISERQEQSSIRYF